MFKLLAPPERPQVAIRIGGREVAAPEGDNLAAVLLREGFTPFRATPVSGSGRNAYCMMGICFDCLVTIDGVPNRQACMEQVRAGLAIERQDGASAASATGGRS
jgi:predicted molibdopterin-dependent oxidoreductase YjgC